MPKKVVHISESELRELIKEAIENYCSSLTERSDDTEYDGEPIDISYLFEKEYLVEGLITTYPKDKVKNMLVKEFKLDPSQIYFYKRGKTHLIAIILYSNSATKEVIGNITNRMNSCGYFLCQNYKAHPTIKNVGAIVFEPKFTNDVSEEVRESCRYLFHCTPTKYVQKIMKNGLIPKSKNTLYLYPDRIFLMKGDTLKSHQKEVLKAVQYIRNLGISFEDKYSLLTIDVSKIPDDVMMYNDPNAEDAIFVYDNIPPSAIVKVEDFK